jgi:Glycosyltransferase family 87
MEQSQLGVDSHTLWYVLWSTMCFTSVSDALAPYPILSGKMGMIFNLLVAAIAGIQMLGRGTFLRHKEAGLATVLLMVFITAQLSQWARTMGPPSPNRGVDFSAYYLAARVVSERPAQSLYQLPLYADGRMDLNALAPLSSSWHTAALRYNVPFSAPYIYPPFFAILMKPFARLSFSSALTAWKLSTVLLLVAAVLLSLSIGGVRIDARLALILCTGLFSYYPFLDNLFWGQVGGLILFLLAAGVWLLGGNRTSLSALCFAAATLIKLTPALAVPVLVFHRRWKWLAAYGVWIIVILIFSVWQAGWAMHQQFWSGVLQKISCGVPVSENSSVVAYVQDLFLGQVHSAQSPPLTIPPYACTVSRFVAFAIYLLMLVRFYSRRRDGDLVRDLVIMALLGIVVSPISWWHQYTIGVLPFLYLWCKMPGKLNRTLLALFVAVGTNVIGFILLSVNNHVAQLILAAIVPSLTVTVAYLGLLPTRELPIGRCMRVR